MRYFIFIFCGLSLVASLLFGSFVAGYHYAGNNEQIAPPSIDPVQARSELSHIVNEWKGTEYKTDRILCGMAKQRLEEVKTNWSHEDFFGMLENTMFVETAENLAKNYSSTDKVLSDWLASPSHRANLEADYEYMCIETDGRYYVQLFANL